MATMRRTLFLLGVLLRDRGEVDPTTTGHQRTVAVEHLCLRQGRGAAVLDDPAHRTEIALRGTVVVDSKVYRRDGSTHSRGQRPVRGQVDDRGQDAAVRVA